MEKASEKAKPLSAITTRSVPHLTAHIGNIALLCFRLYKIYLDGVLAARGDIMMRRSFEYSKQTIKRANHRRRLCATVTPLLR